MGADDFITKPCDHTELFARMQAIVRRSKGYSQPTLHCGPLQLNLDSREVFVAGRQVHLTGKEFAILELLVLRKGMVLTKEVFLNHLYGGMDEPEMKIIDVFICKLRKKLAEAGAPNVVGTVWGRGYMVRDVSSHPMLATTAVPLSGWPSRRSGSRHDQVRLGVVPRDGAGCIVHMPLCQNNPCRNQDRSPVRESRPLPALNNQNRCPVSSSTWK